MNDEGDCEWRYNFDLFIDHRANRAITKVMLSIDDRQREASTVVVLLDENNNETKLTWPSGRGETAIDVTEFISSLDPNGPQSTPSIKVIVTVSLNRCTGVVYNSPMLTISTKVSSPSRITRSGVADDDEGDTGDADGPRLVIRDCDLTYSSGGSLFDNNGVVDSGTFAIVGRCCRYKYIASFNDTRWKDYIVEPQQFQAAACIGRCSRFATPATDRTSNIDFYVEQMDMNRHRLPISPCCSPVSFDPITITVRGSTNDETKPLTIPNILVSACGCI